jgi:Spy/CpxP family protein refolding chaperone
LQKGINRNTIGAAILFVALPIVALAQSAAPPPADAAQKAEGRAKIRAACETDIQKFCANVERGKHAMRSCLESHQNDLFAACKAARAERVAARAKNRS